MSRADNLVSASGLPVAAVIDEIRCALAERDELVLEAPPGAGKTTLVPLALLDQSWLAGRKILLLEPRRLAARAAAERMAALLGEKVGETVGYRMRLDTRVGPATRLEVITEGILTRMLQSDPALEGVGLLVFDEFHERNLDSDLGLALALQGRSIYREPETPLKLLVMSATLDAAAIAKLLDSAPLVRCQGRAFPVELHYGAAAKPGESVVAAVVDTLLSVLGQQPQASVLVFLPGQGEIRRVAEQLATRLAQQDPGRQLALDIAPLYGNLSLSQQRLAIEPPTAGRRKVVLATNIAETSLTIEGVSVVIDGGLERAPVFDPATAMTRLRTRRISRASSIQRMGRAGRLGPGTCYRLWSEAQQHQLLEHTEPEILQADLAPLALQLLAWGVNDTAELAWLDAPPVAAYSQALDLLRSFGALRQAAAGQWLLSAHGEQMASMPVHPRFAHMLLAGADSGLADMACQLAALLAERNPVPHAGVDLSHRLSYLSGAAKATGSVRPWRERVLQQARQYAKLLPTSVAGAAASCDTHDAAGLLLAMAYPDRIARRRAGAVYQLANGRSATLEPDDALVNSEWLAVAELGGRVGAAQDRIFAAAAFDAALFEGRLACRVQEEQRAAWDDDQGRIVARALRRVGAIELSSRRLPAISGEARRVAQLEMLRRRGIGILPWDGRLRQWQARVLLLRSLHGAAPNNPWPDISDSALLATADNWLLPAIADVDSLARLQKIDLAGLLANLLPWPLPRELEQMAPRHIDVPSGSRLAIDYLQHPPVLAVKLQEMFGCEQTPAIAGGRVPLLLHLLSPARRPLQVTQDLAGFWRSSYQEVKKDMKGRYPKHPWPDDPLQATPTRHVKKRR